MYQYMVRWGNLTKYSQQGWEALNSLIKLFFFQRTNKGGCRSGLDGTKRKLLLIGQLMQRRFFWICNLVPSSFWDKDFELEDVDKNFSFDKDMIFNSDLLAEAWLRLTKITLENRLDVYLSVCLTFLNMQLFYANMDAKKLNICWWMTLQGKFLVSPTLISEFELADITEHIPWVSPALYESNTL